MTFLSFLLQTSGWCHASFSRGATPPGSITPGYEKQLPREESTFTSPAAATCAQPSLWRYPCLPPLTCRAISKRHTVELALPDEGGHGRGGHDGFLAHQDLFNAVCGRQLDDDLGCLLVVVAPIATQPDGLALGLLSQRVEQGLDPADA